MFNIPNSADAFNVLQAQPDSRDFSAMLALAFSGTGIVTGCAVTAQGSPNMTVAVASGTVAVAGTIAAVTGGNVTITTANATNPRFDLICVDNAGVKSAVAGTPAVAPVFPDPVGKAVLAAVLVPAAAGSITNQMITDKRLTAVVVPATEATGVIKLFAGGVAPGGYLLCDGSPVSRTTFSVLYALVGNAYGAGDGSTTFNVPDLRGRAAVGVGTNADVNALATNDGLAVASRSPKHNSTPSLTLPNHLHAFSDPGHTHTETGGRQGIYGPTGGGDAAVSGGVPHDTIQLSTNQTGITVGNPTTSPAINGSIGPGGTRPTDQIGFLAVNYIIKT